MGNDLRCASSKCCTSANENFYDAKTYNQRKRRMNRAQLPSSSTANSTIENTPKVTVDRRTETRHSTFSTFQHSQSVVGNYIEDEEEIKKMEELQEEGISFYDYVV